MTSNNTPADVREAAAKIALSWTPVDGHAVEQHPLESPCGWIRRCIAAAIRNMPLPSAAIGSHAGDAGLPMSAAALAKHYEASKRDVVTLVGSEVRQIIGELQHYRAMPLPDGGKLRSERAQIVAWLNNNAPLGFTEAWLEAADAIERGDHIPDQTGKGGAG